MKNRILPVLWMIGICACAKGQSFTNLTITNSFSTQLSGFKKAETQISPDTLSLQQINVDSSKTSFYDNKYYLQKSRSQKISGFILIAGGSVLSAVGIRYGICDGYTVMDKKAHSGENKYEYSTYSRLALTGLVMMAGSIPYFIHSLKNKKIAGLKLTCQKTYFGASKKACKKVTGLTFSIPIGK